MIDVAFTPLDARTADTTVVIDVLRATSTVAAALAAGYARVRCVADLDAARALAAPGRVLAGERDCLRPEGFDLNNSPAKMDPPLGEELVLTTTNGVPALAAAARLSPVVLTASLLNLDAVIAVLAADVQLLCAGTHGRAGLDDVYVAGRIAAALGGPCTDAARMAIAVAEGEARVTLVASAGGRALIEAGYGNEVDDCARESVLDVVPRLIDFDRLILAEV